MGQLFTKLFWADAFERAVSTAAQSVLLVYGLSEDVFSVIDFDADLKTLAVAAVGGFLLSIVKALAAARVGSKDSASLIG